MKKQAKKYKNHKNSQLLLKEISKLLFDNLDTAEQEELNNIINEKILENYNKGINFFNNGNLLDATKSFLEVTSNAKLLDKLKKEKNLCLQMILLKWL